MIYSHMPGIEEEIEERFASQIERGWREIREDGGKAQRRNAEGNLNRAPEYAQQKDTKQTKEEWQEGPIWIQKGKKQPWGSNATVRKHATEQLQTEGYKIFPFSHPCFCTINLKCLKRMKLHSVWVIVHSYKYQEVTKKSKGKVMHQWKITPRPEERKNEQEEKETVRRRTTERSWLLGLIHGYLLDLQAVVRTDGWDGQTVKWVVLRPVVGGDMKKMDDTEKWLDGWVWWLWMWMPVGDVMEAEDGLREDVGRMNNESLGGRCIWKGKEEQSLVSWDIDIDWPHRIKKNLVQGNFADVCEPLHFCMCVHNSRKSLREPPKGCDLVLDSGFKVQSHHPSDTGKMASTKLWITIIYKHRRLKTLINKPIYNGTT